jgi:hypothetical protein
VNFPADSSAEFVAEQKRSFGVKNALIIKTAHFIGIQQQTTKTSP